MSSNLITACAGERQTGQVARGISEGRNGERMLQSHQGLLPPPWRSGCCPLPPGICLQVPLGLALVSLGWHLKVARSMGLYMTPDHFMQVLFCVFSCPLCHPPTARGHGEALQAPQEVCVLLREAGSARRCHPQPSTEFSMSPESQQGNSNYAQGTRVQNKPQVPSQP